MPVVTALVASKADQANPGFAVPFNMLAAAFGSAAMANLTVDQDDFVRRQVMIEAPEAGTPDEALNRSMACTRPRSSSDKQRQIRDGRLYLGDREIPVDRDRNMTINYAGPADTFPQRFALRFHRGSARRKPGATRKVGQRQGRAARPGRQSATTPRHSVLHRLRSDRQLENAGVEIHANTLRTLLTGDFLSRFRIGRGFSRCCHGGRHRGGRGFARRAPRLCCGQR